MEVASITLGRLSTRIAINGNNKENLTSYTKLQNTTLILVSLDVAKTRDKRRGQLESSGILMFRISASFGASTCHRIGNINDAIRTNENVAMNAG